MVAQTVVVVGGNGFIGHSVCRAALRRGWKVHSISRSGQPFACPKGHVPTWASSVEWHAASVFKPETYRSLVGSATAVVHTLGTLLENSSYKQAIRQSDAASLAGTFAKLLKGDNPLAKGTEGSYERINKDSALTVLQTYLSEANAPGATKTFVYISAEDIFRPLIPARYILTKREAEGEIADLCEEGGHNVRPVFIRPSLVYHPHLRPLTSPLAALLSASANIHHKIAPMVALTPASILRSLSSNAGLPSLDSIANALTIPPIHVEHVADAVCVSIEDQTVRGPIGVGDMRRLIGWEMLGKGDIGHATL